jgi:hypothetical protein
MLYYIALKSAGVSAGSKLRNHRPPSRGRAACMASTEFGNTWQARSANPPVSKRRTAKLTKIENSAKGVKGFRVDGEPKSELEHFYKCPACGSKR